ncbi:ABC transporter substrate-binding protein [Corynebacterium hansenii]|uniref:ABC transporter substrate-binding protein n=1 Tax=Corynebacterium hansenii TaxID=394964 RepID=A0ABV7ZQT2_9CORY|nr:ABC transporter substrate-binding protein [Corynebacterium hansenii]WJZ00189.1 Glutamine-binding periplasmic protein precursor [Corynebacterium hansenii]
MRRPLAAAAATLAAALTMGLAGCVTNDEGGHPDGWEPVTPAAVPELADRVPEAIRARGTISIGTNPTFAPLEFKDSRGQKIGFDLDLARAAAGVLGLELDVREQDFTLILPSISAGTVDFGASGFTSNEERRRTYDFVDYLDTGLQWARPAGSTITPDDACGREISVQRGTVAEMEDLPARSDACVSAGKPPIKRLAYQDAGTAATAVVLGRADAMAADSPVSAWAVGRADGKLELAGGIYDGAPFGWPVPKGSELAPLLADALQHLIDTGEYERILHMWGLDDGAVNQARINGEDIR